MDSANAILGHLNSGAHTLIINSSGGDACAGILLAREITARKTFVIVEKFCFSSCANYIFLPAYKKMLMRGAVLGFHGGVDGDHDKARNSTIPIVQREIERQRRYAQQDKEFFAQIGVNRELFKISYEITKPAEIKYTYTGTANGQVNVFTSESAATEFLGSLAAQGKPAALSISIEAISSDKVYFPNSDTLRRYGVHGILTYPYPANQNEMDKLAKTIDDAFEAVGDF
ncbi:hypothetical protein GTP38_20390 [Duganella sp. FT94W]|uniref:Uncharacterized protein n=2 Tax=Duganella lactea TaxID=2692173 RepID=A0ABW9VAN9_9BURK|nr:hypothetical protein [Duganella lactea]